MEWSKGKEGRREIRERGEGGKEGGRRLMRPERETEGRRGGLLW